MLPAPRKMTARYSRSSTDRTRNTVPHGWAQYTPMPREIGAGEVASSNLVVPTMTFNYLAVAD